MRRTTLAIAAVSALAVLAPVRPPVAAAAVICQNQIIGSAVKGPVLVPAGSSCRIHNTEVTGSIAVNGGVLVLDQVFVDGNVVYTGAGGRNVICNSTITGSVSSTNLRPDGLFQLGVNDDCGGGQILGGASFTGNKGPIEFFNAGIGANMVVANNTGGVQLANLTVKNVLACTGNTPRPTVTPGFSVTARMATGQCAA